MEMCRKTEREMMKKEMKIALIVVGVLAALAIIRAIAVDSLSYEEFEAMCEEYEGIPVAEESFNPIEYKQSRGCYCQVRVGSTLVTQKTILYEESKNKPMDELEEEFGFFCQGLIIGWNNMATILKDFAKSKKEFIQMLKKNKTRLERDFNIKISKVRPAMIEKVKAYKGYMLDGKLHERVISPDEAKRIGAKLVYGNWNDYVNDYVKPVKKGEAYYEYRIDVDKLR
jgi:hypothetical protein